MLGILVMLTVFWAAYWAATVPVVRFSYATDECVSVDDPTGQYNCEALPKRYIHQWVN